MQQVIRFIAHVSVAHYQLSSTPIFAWNVISNKPHLSGQTYLSSSRSSYSNKNLPETIEYYMQCYKAFRDCSCLSATRDLSRDSGETVSHVFLFSSHRLSSLTPNSKYRVSYTIIYIFQEWPKKSENETMQFGRILRASRNFGSLSY